MKRSELKTILWDNDGILVNTERLYYQATKEVLSSVGVILDDEGFREHFLVSSKGVWHLVEQTDESLSVDELKEIRKERYSELLKTENIFVESAEGVLKTLSKQFQMAVVTSSLKEHFSIIHERTGFNKYFEFVVASGDYENSKPNPEPYLLGIAKSGHTADECLSIEDSQRGLQAAKSAGLECWCLPCELNSRSDFSQADRILNRLPDVVEFLT